MLLSTSIDQFEVKLGYEETIRMLARAGFDAFDFSVYDAFTMDHVLNTDRYIEVLDGIKKVMQEEKIVCNQSHAIFGELHPTDEEYNKMIFDITVRNMECASYVGARNIVVHPIYCAEFSKEEQIKQSLEMYARLEEYAEKYNIKISVENIVTRDITNNCFTENFTSLSKDLVAYFDRLNSKWFEVCLDIGHSGVSGENPADAIRVLGKNRLKALHVHDVDYIHDSHNLPFMEKLNWEEITRALGEIDYDGDFTFESPTFSRNFPPELMPSSAKMMHDTGRYLIDRINHYRK